MATRVFVTSAEGGSGKSTVAVGLLQALTGSAAAVRVYRPIARGADDYVLEALRAHSGATVPLGDAIGVGYDDLHADPDAALARILERYRALEDDADAVLILGSDYTDVAAPTELAVNARIAATLDAPVVLVLAGRDPDGAWRSASAVAEVGRIAVAELRAEHARPIAIVVNRADPGALPAIADAVRERTGAPTWAIPEDATLSAPLLSTVLAAADAELWRGDPELLSRPVSGAVVAAMTMENVLPRLQEGAVVVVPGDRSDVLIGSVVAHLAQTFPTLAGIVLNGGFATSEPVTRLLDGLGARVPIARTALGTYDTAVRITRARSRLAADSPEKYALALGLAERHVDLGEIVRLLSVPASPVMTPLRFEQLLVERARAHRRRIVLPEGGDDRILRAAAAALQRGIADITILGEEAAVRARAAELGVDIAGAAVVSPHDPELVARFAEEYHRRRAAKGVTLERAAEVVTDVAYFGTMMVLLGLADGMVSGAVHTTAHTIRPAFEVVKTRPGVSVVSSVFLMALADRVLVYGDCAVIPEPTVEQLADIAISSADTARRFGIEPRVAMLSYSTGESGSGSDVDEVRAATDLVRRRDPELPVAGPIQYDAAADPDVGAAKMPGSDVAGRATVFVFPDLNTGNNTYKAVQRSAGAVAIGPVLQGLAKPINDLSRGALVRDIVNTIAITAIQAQEDA
ncbi:phosphate acetyltransferase [Pseudolysinimonas sp.]|uniref:phosphate acetyltransferase n=1 Tax=Pseudolysinimonas sp. TaxID=2680009 RepID=UPI003F815285